LSSRSKPVVAVVAFLVCHPRRGPAVVFAVVLAVVVAVAVVAVAVVVVAVVAVAVVAVALASRYTKASALGLSFATRKRGL
jgi:cell division protein FtsW (lipid II flippase)